MHLSSLKLFNFRNLTNQTVSLSPRLNLIRGLNGQGKTNLLEAAYVLSCAKSFRTSVHFEMVTWGQSEGSVFGSISNQIGEKELGVIIKQRERQVYVGENKSKSLVEYFGNLICVNFSPSDISLVKEGAVERRKFLDRLACEITPGLLTEYSAYSKALKSKLSLLKKGARNPAEFQPWNHILMKAGKKISMARAALVDSLNEKSCKIYSYLVGGKEALELKIQSEILGFSVEELEHQAATKLGSELALKKCLVGCHRDEMQITIDAKSARSFASQGQSKSVVLALKIGAVDLIESLIGEMPVILLDDLDSELDQSRREKIYELVNQRTGQVLISGTEFGIANDSIPDALFMEILGGKVETAH